MMSKFFRKIGKGRHPPTHHTLSLDSVTQTLTTTEEMQPTFDQEKLNVEQRLGHFMMILGPHEFQNGKPNLLFLYPLNKFPYDSDSFSRIVQFCYPRGMYKAKNTSNTLQEQFVFTLNENGTLIFGICTHFILKNIDHFLSNVSDDQVYCLCTFTSVPNLSAHFQLHIYLISVLIGRKDLATNVSPELLVSDDITLQGYEENKDIILQRLEQFSLPLHPHEHIKLAASINPIYISRTFLSAVELYMRLKVDISRTFRVSDEAVHISRPSESLSEVAKATFDVLFSCLSIEDVVRVFRALLMEQRIIFVSDNLTILSMTALSTLPMLSPMTYKGIILPILPDTEDFLDFLDTPVPYVIGFLSSQKLTDRGFPEGTTIVDLDRHKVFYPDTTPHMPNAKELRTTLKRSILPESKVPKEDRSGFWTLRMQSGLPTYVKRRLKLQFSFTPEQTAVICSILMNSLEPLISNDRIQGCRIRDTTDEDNPRFGFVKEVYMLPVTSDKDFEFVDSFASTQTFQAYVESALFK